VGANILGAEANIFPDYQKYSWSRHQSIATCIAVYCNIWQKQIVLQRDIGIWRKQIMSEAGESRSCCKETSEAGKAEM
jgi:hypothetical protein